jgi:hypothetical protein
MIDYAHASLINEALRALLCVRLDRPAQDKLGKGTLSLRLAVPQLGIPYTSSPDPGCS